MYPAINASVNGELWPVGHPVVFRNNFPDVTDMFGLVYCRVLPPQKCVYLFLALILFNTILFVDNYKKCQI